MADDVSIRELYDDMLDSCYPDVEIGDLKYAHSVALYRIDPIAYQVGLNDYESSLRSDYQNYGHYADLFADEEE